MIWCDLDNTLIWTWEPLISTPLLSLVYKMPLEEKPARGKGRRNCVRIDVPGFGTGYACCRKSSHQFLRELRRVAPVRMLTSAARAYAEAMNAKFGFGFTTDHIVSREDFGHSGPKGIDPSAVLIDNSDYLSGDHRHLASRQRKIAYLGIKPDRVLEVPYFEGATNDPFDRDWRGTVAEVRRLVHTATR